MGILWMVTKKVGTALVVLAFWAVVIFFVTAAFAGHVRTPQTIVGTTSGPGAPAVVTTPSVVTAHPTPLTHPPVFAHGT